MYSDNGRKVAEKTYFVDKILRHNSSAPAFSMWLRWKEKWYCRTAPPHTTKLHFRLLKPIWQAEKRMVIFGIFCSANAKTSNQPLYLTFCSTSTPSGKNIMHWKNYYHSTGAHWGSQLVWWCVLRHGMHMGCTLVHIMWSVHKKRKGFDNETTPGATAKTLKGLLRFNTMMGAASGMPNEVRTTMKIWLGVASGTLKQGWYNLANFKSPSLRRFPKTIHFVWCYSGSPSQTLQYIYMALYEGSLQRLQETLLKRSLKVVCRYFKCCLCVLWM